jgi:hypothetical protein
MSNRLEIIIDDQIVNISVYRFSSSSHLLSIKYDDIYLIEKLEILRVHSYIRYNKQFHVYNILDNLFNKNKYTFLQFKNRRLYLTENDELERLIKEKEKEKENNESYFSLFFTVILLIVIFLTYCMFEKELVSSLRNYYNISDYEPILFHT